MQPSKIICYSRCSANTQKTNLRQFFLQCWRLTNFNRTELLQGDLLKKHKENNLAKVNFLKLLTKKHHLECFHWFTTYQKRRRIFAHQNFLKKVRANKVDFLTIKITSKKVETPWISQLEKLHRKMYVETTRILRSSIRYKGFTL